MTQRFAPSMRGKWCLVTGASRGIGRETSLALARLGAHLVLVGRDRARTEEAARAVRAAGGPGQVEVLLADLAEPDQVAALAEAYAERHEGLDVLVNNAGAIFERRRTTRGGLEMTFALNHLAYHALTVRLLPLLARSPEARVVVVASRAHVNGRLDLDDPLGERHYNGWQAYCASKLANVLFTRELATRLTGTGVTANALHPGLVATSFGHGEPGWYRWLVRLGRPWMVDAREGSRTTVHLATSPDLAGRSGEYWARCRPDTPSPAAQDPDAGRRLWELSVKLTGVDWPASTP
ncbi:MAG: SDR family oxidoreductase [Candidatus Sericytochromatia bacterium]|nr:SDR family oxidoreductase [Candidatus Sericytochromatia bacterium]